ncbi:unnamed protein product [Lactuca virosa]|uniref:F-box associated domain-containing protein n=1 Tax=Lactuca virosa TaxID=75947 RepID=A0AAU9PRK7_9ASTR|nr:unnamed protein product [Lactuca virosa]
MAKAGDGRTPYESGAPGEKFTDRPFNPEKSTGMSPDQGENSTASGISEPEQVLEQETVIRLVFLPVQSFIVINLFFHWENTTDSSIERMIVPFDLGLETFHEIPLPDYVLDSNHGMHCLGVLGGKICEMTWCMDGPCEVWVIEEYVVPESWVKRHVFTQFTAAAWRFPFGFTSRNELLLEDKDGRLVLYDAIANKTISTHTKQKALQILEYVDSLVWF